MISQFTEQTNDGKLKIPSPRSLAESPYTLLKKDLAMKTITQHYGSRMQTCKHVYVRAKKLLALLVAALISQGAFAQIPPGLLRIQPAIGRAGEKIAMKAFGTNLSKGMVVKIGNLNIATHFSTSKRLDASFTIPSNYSPGPKDVTLWSSKTQGILISTLTNGFEITSPPPPELPQISKIYPTRAQAGTTVTMRVDGNYFDSQMAVRVQTFDVNTTWNFFGTKLTATFKIPPDAPPGFRTVTLWSAKSGGIQFPNINQQFEVIPDSTPLLSRAKANLSVALDGHSATQDQLTISVRVANEGNASSSPTLLRVKAEGWLPTSLQLPGFNPQANQTFTLTMAIPKARVGQNSQFTIEVEPQNEAPGTTANNQIVAQIFIPSPHPPVILLFVVVIITIAGVALCVNRVRLRARRKRWQSKAEDERPELPCRRCDRRCYKRKKKIEAEAEITLTPYKVEEAFIIAKPRGSKGKSMSVEVESDVLKELNRAVENRRNADTDVKLMVLVEPVANVIARAIGEALKNGTAPQDVRLSANLKGSEIEFEFTLYECKKKGPVTTWEEVDSWEASLEDEREMQIADLQDLSTHELDPFSKERTAELAQHLTTFVKSI